MVDTPLFNGTTIDAHETHQADSFYSVLIVTAVILASLLNVFLHAHRFNRFFPESGASILFGTLMGVVLKVSGKTETVQQFFFHPEMFYFILLPPIIFDAGFSMKQKNFFRNMGTILLYAFIGTLISALVFGYGMYLMIKMNIVTSIDRNHPLESLLFGALISATDPVATLSIMSSLNVKPLLFSLVFGESVLNDAVSIVLYHALNKFIGVENFAAKQLFSGLFDFFVVTIGSFGIGVAFGLFSAMILKWMSFIRENTPFQVLLIVSFAYLSYVTAELAELTGIVSIFVTATVMQHYHWYSISNEAQVSTKHLSKMFAMISETVIFVYLGINLVLSFENVYHWDPIILLVSVPLLLLCRACNIFPISFIANLRRKEKIPLKVQIMLWFAGMRGAIAFALSINLTVIILMMDAIVNHEMSFYL